MGWIDGLLGGFGSLIGSGINAGVQSQINKQNADLQKEFAQNSLQWKVQDAKKAGIAPEIALGAQGYSASPSYVGSDSGGVSSAFKHFGSAIDNYINDEEDKRQLELESLKLDNETKRAELMKLKNAKDPDLYGGTLPNAYVPQPFTQIFETANGDKVVSLHKDLMDYASENKFQNVAMNNRIISELENHAYNLNKKMHASTSNFRYVPASIAEMAQTGLPYVKMVTKQEWNDWVDRRKNEAAKKAKEQRYIKGMHKKYGDPKRFSNTSTLTGRRVPTDFNF